MAPVMTTDRLERCPNCGGDLATRPPPNRCPDCSFEYDEHTRVWRSDESWGRLATVYATIGLVAGVVLSLLYRLSFASARYPVLPLVLGLIAPALGLFLRRLIGGRITGRFVALTPRGILVGTRRTPPLVPWDAFEQLTEQHGVVKLRCCGSTTLVPLDDIFASPAEVAAFERALHEALRRHRGLEGTPPTTTL
jgi:hypothetical protein